MSVEVLTSKLYIPPLRTSMVPRPRLVRLLEAGLDAKHRLTLICAPAGFGKTTLVVDWLRQAGLPAAWLSLEEADNDLLRFLTYLASSFQQADEELGASLRSALQSPRLPALEKLLTGLLNEIAARGDPLLLVLDDVHLITEETILRGMEFLLDHQPPQLHLVLTTREDPGLPLARLRAREQLTEIRARDLRFTREEVELFLRDVMGLALSDQEVAVLEGRTEGWAVGLQLAGISMQKQADLKSFIKDFSGSHRHILDYLTNEVLQQQPEEIRAFLLQTSILERLCSPLCDALLGRTDSERVLAYLEAANLFLIPLDEERRWYRYHHLFSDLLRSQMLRSQRESIPGLHRRASLWFAENGDVQEAIDHALQDTELTPAVQLIRQNAFPKLYHGQVAIVLGWLDRLPERVLESAPMLCIARAWTLALLRDSTRRPEVDLALQEAGRALEQTGADEALHRLVAGHTASIQAFLLPMSEPEKVIALSAQAQRLLPAEAKATHSANALNIGYGYLALGNLDAARLAFQQVLEQGLAGRNYYAAIFGSINLVQIDLLVGHQGEALQRCDTNIRQFNQIHAGRYFPSIGALLILKGSILLEQDDLEEAGGLLTEGLDLIRWTEESTPPRTGYTALARLRAIRGDRPGMLEAVRSLEQTLPGEALYAQALRHRLSMRCWPADPQVQQDARSWLSHSGIEFGRLGVVSSLNPSNSAQLESYLNAAHVLARLAKDAPAAHPPERVHTCLRRQAEFAETHGIVNWVVRIAIARTVLYQAAGRRGEALKALAAAVRAAAPAGLFRMFLDECDILQPLLEDLRRQLTDQTSILYASRLSEALSAGSGKTAGGDSQEPLLSGRELEVLQNLAHGLSYEETGRQLYLSLNTIQFHVKNIYRKLLVNKRVLAIERARELGLI